MDSNMDLNHKAEILLEALPDNINGILFDLYERTSMGASLCIEIDKPVADADEVKLYVRLGWIEGEYRYNVRLKELHPKSIIFGGI